MKTELNNCFMTFRLPTKMRSNLEEIAMKNECTVSSVVRYAVKNIAKNER